jgi:hypothetical protein
VPLGDVGRAHEGRHPHGRGAIRVGLRGPGVQPVVVPPEPEQRAVEPLERGRIVRRDLQRARRVERRAVRAPDEVEDRRQPHLLERDRVRLRQQREPPLPHRGRRLPVPGLLQQTDEVRERAPRRLRVRRRPRGRALQERDRVLRGLEARREDARGGVVEPRCARVVRLPLGLAREGLHEGLRAVVAHEVPRERVAHRPGRALEGDRPLQRGEREVRLSEALLQDRRALDEHPRGEPRVAVGLALGRRVALRQRLQVLRERGHGPRALVRAQHGLEPAQGRRVLRHEPEGLLERGARLREPAERGEQPGALPEQIGPRAIRLGRDDRVVHEPEHHLRLDRRLHDAAQPIERRLEEAHEGPRLLVETARDRDVPPSTLYMYSKLHEGARGPHRILRRDVRGAQGELLRDRVVGRVRGRRHLQVRRGDGGLRRRCLGGGRCLRGRRDGRRVRERALRSAGARGLDRRSRSRRRSLDARIRRPWIFRSGAP